MNACSSKAICSRCGGDANQNIKDCTRVTTSPFCINCGGEHKAKDRCSPEYVKQRDCRVYAYSYNINFKVAKRALRISPSLRENKDNEDKGTKRNSYNYKTNVSDLRYDSCNLFNLLTSTNLGSLTHFSFQ